ncbi:MAG: hypothetical protein IKC89_03740 [Lentisphaeria bacterium]|nr:hypothetical protein [Lentisphaeria bacterium]
MKTSLRISCFTLIELVISMGILMAVTGIIAMASKSFYDGYERSAKVTNRLKEYMAIDNMMDVHVRNLIPFQWTDENGNKRFVFSGEEHKLHFTTLRRTYGPRAGALIFIRLFVEENKLIAEYSTYPRLPWKEDEEETMPYKREIIAENVEQITFTYAEKAEEEEDEDGTGITWEENWPEDEHAAPPLAIRMKVEWTDGSSEYWLRRVAGVAKDSTFGKRETTDGTTSRFSNSLEGGATGGGGSL